MGATLGILFLGWLGFSALLGDSSLDITWGEMALPFISLLGQALIFGTMALLLSIFLPAKSLASLISGLFLVCGYILSSMSSLNEDLGVVTKIFPYTNFQGSDAFTSFNLTWLLALMGVSAMMALIAWWRFVRRDIRLSGEGNFRIPGRFSLRSKTT